MVAVVSSMRGSSSGTASLLSDSVDRLPLPAAKDPSPFVIIEDAVTPEWRVGPGTVLGVDPGATTFFSKVAPYNEPVPFRDRLAFWQRVKTRRAEKAADRAREDQPFDEWIRGLVPDKVDSNFIAAGTVTGDQIVAESIVWTEGEVDTMKLARAGYEAQTPISSARRTRQVQTLETIDVDEVFWDLASMIDAHRNGATALERSLDWEDRFADTPVWDDLTSRKWDPTHEMGPRERDWIRKQAKS